MLSCLTVNIIRYGSSVKWSNPGKGVAPSPTSWCSSYQKGRLQVTLYYGRQLYFHLHKFQAIGSTTSSRRSVSRLQDVLTMWMQTDIQSERVKNPPKTLLRTWFLRVSLQKILKKDLQPYRIQIKHKLTPGGGARGVMVIVVENGHGDASSNPGRDWLHFTLH